MEREQSDCEVKIEKVSLFRELSDHAKTQIDRAWDSYALLAKLLGIIFSVGLIILYFLYGNSYKSLENNIQERTSLVNEQVEKRIEKEFDSNNIEELIQDAANEAAIKQIDILKITKIINDEVEKVAQTKVKEINNQIQLLKDENVKALDSLSILADLTLALSNAAYDMESLKKLKEISEYSDSKTAIFAKKCLNRTVEEIEQTYNRINSDYWGFKSVDDRYFGLKSTKDWKLENFLENYSSVTSDTKVVYVNKYLSDPQNDNISKFKFSYSILKKENKPEIVYTICVFVNSVSKINKDYLFESIEYIDWLKSKI